MEGSWSRLQLAMPRYLRDFEVIEILRIPSELRFKQLLSSKCWRLCRFDLNMSFLIFELVRFRLRKDGSLCKLSNRSFSVFSSPQQLKFNEIKLWHSSNERKTKSAAYDGSHPWYVISSMTKSLIT